MSSRSGGPSILRNLLLSFLGFGLGVALLFPFYADFFVTWKPGMLPWFVAGCVVAGLSIGIATLPGAAQALHASVQEFRVEK